ncbi:LysR substrate-binding domain-containing protein [Chelatococcus reniformis]|nr:LysR substrate-binding domain-containing protein [Chelatococcus reniformis]
MSRRMPPLNPLHVFEVAARLGGFTRAAEELNVTQSAVSRQVAVLESYFGQRLFQRDRSGASLTEAGRALAVEIAEPFARLAAAGGRFAEREKTDPVRLRAYTTFATRWLIPRLPAFRLLNPGVSIFVSNTVKPVDFERENVDLAIQLGSGDWPGLAAHLLFADEIEPICSPALLRKGPPLESIEDLSGHTLLHSYYRRRDWSDWLTEAGHPEVEHGRSLVFESSTLTYQAAVEGLGVAIGQNRLLADEFADRRLVRPFAHPVTRNLAYYVVWPADREPSRKMRLLVSWLKQEADGAGAPPSA